MNAATTETAAVKTLVTAETTARTDALATVTSDIAAINTAMTTATTNEDAKIATEQGRITAAETALQTETTAREADTSTLTTNMATLTTNTNARIDAVDAEIKGDVQTAMAAVTGTGTANAQKVTANSVKLSQEEDERKASDSKYEAEIAGLTAKVQQLAGALQDVQQGKAIDIPALQAAMHKQTQYTSAFSSSPAK